MLACYLSNPAKVISSEKMKCLIFLLFLQYTVLLFLQKKNRFLSCLLFLCQPPDPGQADWIYVDTSSRPQWDDWESLRIIQVVQNALIHVGAGMEVPSSSPAVQGLPDATRQPAATASGPRQLLAQAWRVRDMRTWMFEPPSCTTQVNCSQVDAFV